jgi:hypothetical protein
MPLSKNVAAQPIFQSCTICFVSWSLLRLWLAKNFLGVDKQMIITWCKVGTVWQMLENFLLEPVNVLTLFLVMHISYAFSEKPTPLPHITFICSTFTTDFNNLPVNEYF